MNSGRQWGVLSILVAIGCSGQALGGASETDDAVAGGGPRAQSQSYAGTGSAGAPSINTGSAGAGGAGVNGTADGSSGHDAATAGGGARGEAGGETSPGGASPGTTITDGGAAG
jgi:hypothetical protein